MTLNPFRYLAEQRALDRADRLAEREAMLAVVNKALDASASQSDAFRAWMDSFRIVDPPRVRQFDEAADQKRWLEEHGYNIPAELANLTELEQYRALVTKMNSFALDDDDIAAA